MNVFKHFGLSSARWRAIGAWTADRVAEGPSNGPKLLADRVLVLERRRQTPVAQQIRGR
jgi:hypothetical protein